MSSPDEIRLTLPAAVAYGRVARLALTGLASRQGFTYDDVEDVRIAVGELFSLMVHDAPPEARILLRCDVADDALQVVAEAVPPRPITAIGDLSRQILLAVTEHTEIDEQAGRISITARRR